MKKRNPRFRKRIFKILGLWSSFIFSIEKGLPGREAPLSILSIDGGGIRGLIPALLLQELEEKTGKPVSALFQVIVGTSTGGILALGLTAPQNQHPRYTAASLAHLYRTQGSTIFPQGFWTTLRHTAGWWRSRYDASPLEDILQEKFGSLALFESLVPVGVTSFETRLHSPFLLNSHGFYLPHVHTMSMRQAARATSAAPLYFEPCYWKNHQFIDGGISANNPALVALWYAQHLYPHGSYELISLGTGKRHPTSYPGGGLFKGGRQTLQLMMEGPMESTHQAVTFSLYSLGGMYRRFNPLLSKPIDLADTSPASLSMLEKAALSSIRTPSFQDFISRMKEK